MGYPRTNQAIFNKVWRYFVKEGRKPRLSRENTCLYRYPGGGRCAVGCLFDDRIPALQNRQAVDQLARWAVTERPALGAFLERHLPFLYRLQVANDSCAMNDNGQDFRKTLVKLAAHFDLKVPK